MNLAVENRGRKAEDVLAMQLLRDARKRGREVTGIVELEISAAVSSANRFKPESGLLRT